LAESEFGTTNGMKLITLLGSTAVLDHHPACALAGFLTWTLCDAFKARLSDTPFNGGKFFGKSSPL
jgi:hypothetical protein